MPREKSSGAIIFREKEGNIYYLLLHHGSSRNKGGHWDFPKGHIEEGEKNRQTAIREVEEETGIRDLKMIPGFKSWIKYFFRKNYGLKDKTKAPLIFKTVNFYLAKTNTEKVKLSDEHIGYKWLDYDSALKQLTHRNAKNILKEAKEFLNKTRKMQ
jgi:8-oxo-dGTP pyrophosphatase MutT (NUDIX family)